MQREQVTSTQSVLHGRRLSGAMLVLLAAASGCQQRMNDQPRYEPLESSDFFRDGLASRPQVEGAVARGELRLDTGFYTGKAGEEAVTVFPLEKVAEEMNVVADDRAATRKAVLQRGRERFDIFCSNCHGRTGNGDGTVVELGFRRPPSYHIDRLRAAPVGHLYDVVTQGFGAMPSYAALVRPEDRWAIVAYVRALQLSQNATLDEVPEDERVRLKELR